MSCNPSVLQDVPLFSLLDAEEIAVLAAQVELKTFAPRQRVYKRGVMDGQAYVARRINLLDEKVDDLESIFRHGSR